MTQYMQEAGAMKQADELHAAIMNLPCKDLSDDAFGYGPHQMYRKGYQEGHRDARHAAAELALAAALQPAAVQAPRLLTHDEVMAIIDAAPSPSMPNTFAAIQAKFCEVNGLTMPPLAANEGALTAGKQGGGTQQEKL